MITCSNFPVDDYLDGDLSDAHEAEFLRHLDRCAHCQTRLALEKKRRVVMRSLPSPRLHPDFAQRCFDNVQRQHHRQQVKRRWAMGSGLAAALLVAAAATFITQPWSGQAYPSSHVVVELHDVKDIRFSVTSSQTVVGARLHVRLPDNVELVGYPRMREISWVTDLQQGENRLSLPLKASATGEGDVVMDIYSPSGKKTRKTIQLHTRVAEAV